MDIVCDICSNIILSEKSWQATRISTPFGRKALCLDCLSELADLITTYSARALLDWLVSKGISVANNKVIVPQGLKESVAAGKKHVDSMTSEQNVEVIKDHIDAMGR